jgi:hypothetical protein
MSGDRAKIVITNEGPESVMVSRRFNSPSAEILYPQVMLEVGERTECEISERDSIIVTEIEFAPADEAPVLPEEDDVLKEDTGGGAIGISIPTPPIGSAPLGDIEPDNSPFSPAPGTTIRWDAGKLKIYR